MVECNGNRLLLSKYLKAFCNLYPKVLINLSVDIADIVKEQIDKGMLVSQLRSYRVSYDFG